MKKILNLFYLLGIGLLNLLYNLYVFLKSLRLYITLPTLFSLNFFIFYYYKVFYSLLLNIQEKTQTHKNKIELTYGETPYITIAKAFKYLKLSKNDVFYDLGSGRGKLTIFVNLKYKIPAYGIEIMPTYVRVANTWVKHKKYQNITFYNQDILATDLTQGTIFYLHGTCFSNETQQLIIKKLETVNKNSIILSASSSIKSPSFKLIKKIKVDFLGGVVVYISIKKYSLLLHPKIYFKIATKMLSKIYIKNFALIDNLELDFSQGFTVLTGETGAGKSIITEAISILSGSTLTEDLIKSGEETTIIEGIFNVETKDLPENITDYLDEADNNLIISRKITRGKGSTAKINGQNITLKQLKNLTIRLISISGQHEYLALFDAKKQLELVDTFAAVEIAPLKNKYTEIYAHYLNIKNQLHTLYLNQTEQQNKKDYLTFQITDLEKPGFKIEEEEKLKEQQKQIKNLNFLQTNFTLLSENLDTINLAISKSLSATQKLVQSNANLYNNLNQSLDNIAMETQGAFLELQKHTTKLAEFDASSLEELEDRLDLIFKYKTKYNCLNVEALLNLKNQLQQELDDLNQLSTNKAEISQTYTIALNETKTTAELLHNLRKTKAANLSKLLEQELKDLNFNHNEVVIKINFDENNLTPDGADTIEFLISPNLGEPPKPLAQIASGGELSRIMLAIKTIFFEEQEVETLIFDEIDSGIGGVTALKIGEKIKLISKKCQVLAVTHLPQIAKFADNHFVVSKNQNSHKTYTDIKLLTTPEKATEIQRMIGGKEMVDLFT